MNLGFKVLSGNGTLGNPDTSPGNRQPLRLELRSRRRNLSRQQQKSAARLLARRLVRQPCFIYRQHIAFYLANDGEISPREIMHTALRLGKKCYLPVLDPAKGNMLWFQRYTLQTPMRKNRFGISEPVPDASKRMPAWALDLVLEPLVGFDRSGGRLGMGGGFYDRSFAFTRYRKRPRPVLLGLAHSCQKCSQLPMESWDVPLDGVATEAGIHQFNL